MLFFDLLAIKYQILVYASLYGSVFGYDYIFQQYYGEYRHPYWNSTFVTILIPNIFLFIVASIITFISKKKSMFCAIVFLVWFLNSYMNLYVFIDEKFKSYWSVIIIYPMMVLPYLIALLRKREK
jgi:hypothetical protein